MLAFRFERKGRVLQLETSTLMCHVCTAISRLYAEFSIHEAELVEGPCGRFGLRRSAPWGCTALRLGWRHHRGLKLKPPGGGLPLAGRTQEGDPSRAEIQQGREHPQWQGLSPRVANLML
jgi:hypothetical protein